MNPISFTASKAGLLCTLAFASLSTLSHAAPSDPFTPDFGPSVPDFGFGGTDDCRPIGDLPDFCIPGIGPSIPDPFEGIEAHSAIEIRYRIVNVASEYGETFSDPSLAVYATKAGSGEFFEERRRGWIVLPGPGVYTFGAESSLCVVQTKKVRVTEATRSISLRAVCE